MTKLSTNLFRKDNRSDLTKHCYLLNNMYNRYYFIFYSSKMENKKLIAFDLFDTCLYIPRAIGSPRAKLYKILWITENRKEIGDKLLTSEKTIEEIIWEIVPKEKRKGNMQTYHNEFSAYINSAKLFPETKETLWEIKKRWYKIAAVSNISSLYSPVLYNLLPNMFDYEVLSYKVGYKKPSAEIFEYLKNISWYTSEEIVMVGDGIPSDIEWAKNANIDAIHIERKQPTKKSLEHIQISSLAELLTILT